MKKTLMFLLLSIVLILAACSSGGSGGNKEFPSKNIELIAPASPGGGWDATARAIQKIMIDEDLDDQSINVVNKPGGNGEVGWNYLKSRDAHNLAMTSSLLITNELLGASQINYADLTPMAILTTEWVALAVPEDSPYDNVDDLMNAIKDNPSSFSVGISPGLGSNHHLAFVQAAREYGIKAKDIDFLIYESGGDAITSLLGSHVDVALHTVSTFSEQHHADNIKILAVTSDERLEELEDVPTWTEEGVDLVFPHWRGVMGPPDMTQEEIDYWDDKLSAMVETEGWKTLLKNNEWSELYLNHEETMEFLKEQYDVYENLLQESGLTE